MGKYPHTPNPPPWFNGHGALMAAICTPPHTYTHPLTNTHRDIYGVQFLTTDGDSLSFGIFSVQFFSMLSPLSCEAVKSDERSWNLKWPLHGSALSSCNTAHVYLCIWSGTVWDDVTSSHKLNYWSLFSFRPINDFTHTTWPTSDKDPGLWGCRLFREQSGKKVFLFYF